MSAAIRRYIAERQSFEFNRGFNEQQLAATNLRIGFLKKYILGFDTNLYKTQEERDWTYIAKRQYNYDVVLTGIGYSSMISNSILIWRLYAKKCMVYWPILTIPVFYWMIRPVLLQKHSKKLFDMCNLGDEFYLGKLRNGVLIECNHILNVQDF